MKNVFILIFISFVLCSSNVFAIETSSEVIDPSSIFVEKTVTCVNKNKEVLIFVIKESSVLLPNGKVQRFKDYDKSKDNNFHASIIQETREDGTIKINLITIKLGKSTIYTFNGEVFDILVTQNDINEARKNDQQIIIDADNNKHILKQ